MELPKKILRFTNSSLTGETGKSLLINDINYTRYTSIPLSYDRFFLVPLERFLLLRHTAYT